MTDRFLHAADLHLGARLKSLGSQVDDSTAEHLRAEARKAFGSLIQLAIDREVSFVVLAGDIYDGAERETSAQFEVQRAFARLDKEAIRVFIAHGNHDPVEGNYAKVGDYPDNVTVFPAGEVQSHTVDLRGGGQVQVSGISFRTERESENLALRFHDLVPPGIPHIGVLHTNVGDTSDHGNYAPCRIEHLREAPVDYWALGHIHRRRYFQLGPQRWAVYPGNLQGRSFKASEAEPKGAVLVDVDPFAVGTGIGEPRFVACDRVRFCLISIDVSEATTLGDVMEIVTDTVSAEVADQGDRPVVARVLLTGRPSLDESDRLSAQANNIRVELNNRLIGPLHSGQIAGVSVRTRPPLDPAELRAVHGPGAVALRALDSQRAGPAGQALLREALAALTDIPSDLREALQRQLDDEQHVAELLDRVELRILEELFY